MNYEAESKQYVVFRLCGEEYAFDISSVREIFPTQSITKVHRSPKHIEGVINLRGKLVTVVDLRKRFKLEATPSTDESRIIVVDATDAPTGFLVDEVAEVTRFPGENIEPVPEYVSQGIESEYVSGIANLDGRLVTIIDPLKVLELSDDIDNEGGERSGNGPGS